MDSPNAACDVTRVKAIDSDVLVLLVLKKSMLQFCQPNLEIELVVLIVVDALIASHTRPAVEVRKVVATKEVKTGGGADYTRRGCLR